MKKLTTQLPEELLEDLKDAVVYLQSRGHDATLAGQIKLAIERHMNRLRDSYTRGKQFPKRGKELRSGRRIDL